MASRCSEFSLLDAPRIATPPRLRAPERGNVDLWVVEPGVAPSPRAVPRAEHLETVQQLCGDRMVRTTACSELQNRRGKPTGRTLVILSAETNHGKPNNFLPGHELRGTVVLAAQSTGTGRWVNLRRTDLRDVHRAVTPPNCDPAETTCSASPSCCQ